MEGKPSLTIERTSLLYNEIPCYRRNSITIEGNALRITTNNSWESPTIEGSPLLTNQLFKKIPSIERKPFPYYRINSLTI